MRFEWFSVEVSSQGPDPSQEFERGKPPRLEVIASQRNGTLIHFHAHPEIFSRRHRFKRIAYAAACENGVPEFGMEISFLDERVRPSGKPIIQGRVEEFVKQLSKGKQVCTQTIASWPATL